jgi:two-component system NtrC family sensor kinase
MRHTRAEEPDLVQQGTEWDVLRLASRSQSLSLLQSAAIHDFKGSLNTLSLSVRLLEHTVSAAEGPDADVQRRCVKSLRDELSSLERFTGALLEENRGDDLVVRTFNLATVLDTAALLLGPTGVAQQVTIAVERPSEEITVRGRASWIRHALLNLGGNAIQATPRGGTIRLQLRREEARAVISVIDTGPGIADEVRARMWDVNYSTRKGLGIGLPVVAHIVQAHGGSVAFEPSESGACFAIRLPIAG